MNLFLPVFLGKHSVSQTGKTRGELDGSPLTPILRKSFLVLTFAWGLYGFSMLPIVIVEQNFGFIYLYLLSALPIFVGLNYYEKYYKRREQNE